MASIALFNQYYTSATKFPFGVVIGPIIASGSTDAIPVASCEVFVTTAGVDAMTLATAKAGVYPAGVPGVYPNGVMGDDGKRILVRSTTANAHTITTAANKINGNKHIITFSGAVTDFVELIAYNGIWWTLASSGATLS